MGNKPVLETGKVTQVKTSGSPLDMHSNIEYEICRNSGREGKGKTLTVGNWREGKVV